MELAVGAGFDVHVVPLPPGVDPADAADEFEGLLETASGYLRHRVKLEIDRAGSAQEGFEQVEVLLAKAPRGPDQDEAARYASDRLNVPLRVHAAAGPTLRQVSRKVVGAAARLERELLAICATRPELAERFLTKLDDRHFDEPVHRRLRAYLAGEIEPDSELLALRAELDATAEREGLNEAAAQELFLRLEERLVRRELSDLSGGDLARAVELQGVLAKIQDALREVAVS
jgi:hypothetical protein